MGSIINDGTDAEKAASAWVKAHPDMLDAWLDGVTSADGKPAMAAVKSGLGI